MNKYTKLSKINFISFQEIKNGSIVIHFIERELFNILKEMGYCFAKIEGKPVFYHQDSHGIINVINHFQDLIDAFSNHIKGMDLSPKERDALLNAYYAKRPIKRNGLAEFYLKTEPGIYLVEEIKLQKSSR